MQAVKYDAILAVQTVCSFERKFHASYLVNHRKMVVILMLKDMSLNII